MDKKKKEKAVAGTEKAPAQEVKKARHVLLENRVDGCLQLECPEYERCLKLGIGEAFKPVPDCAKELVAAHYSPDFCPVIHRGDDKPVSDKEVQEDGAVRSQHETAAPGPQFIKDFVARIPGLYEYLVKSADDNLRTLEDQVLFILKTDMLRNMAKPPFNPYLSSSNRDLS